MKLFSSIRGRLKHSGTQADTLSELESLAVIEDARKMLWELQQQYVDIDLTPHVLAMDMILREAQQKLSQRLPQTKASTKAHKNAKET